MVQRMHAAAVEGVGRPPAPEGAGASTPGPCQILATTGACGVQHSDIRPVGVIDAR
jgi:D-arabinose 1-dehydrogenase-like Zn-dependent alcohol dehydrogenase